MTVKKNFSIATTLGLVMGCFSLSLYVRAEDPKNTPPAKPDAAKPEAAKSGVVELSPGAKLEGTTLKLDGINMTIPKEWEIAPVQPSPMGPVAILKLPKAEGEPEDGFLRITFFPTMKGKDDANIDRWLKAVKKADGSEFTRDTAKLTKTDIGNVRLTTVDMSGTVDNSMSGGTNNPGTRMIAAIVDHPKGPHYIKAVGTVKTMEKWQDAIDKFFKSAKVVE